MSDDFDTPEPYDYPADESWAHQEREANWLTAIEERTSYAETMTRMAELLGSPEIEAQSRELIARFAYRHSTGIADRLADLAADPARAGAQIASLAGLFVSLAAASGWDVGRCLNLLALAEEQKR